MYFWTKIDDEKWSRKNIFEIPPCASYFLINGIYKVIDKDGLFAHGGISITLFVV